MMIKAGRCKTVIPGCHLRHIKKHSSEYLFVKYFVYVFKILRPTSCHSRESGSPENQVEYGFLPSQE